VINLNGKGCYNCKYQSTKIWQCTLLGYDSGISSKNKLKAKGIKSFGSLCVSWKEGKNILTNDKEIVTFD
jgi:hypothetical protein